MVNKASPILQFLAFYHYNSKEIIQLTSADKDYLFVCKTYWLEE